VSPSWLQIIIRAPIALVIVLGILLIGLLAAGALIYRWRLNQIRKLSSEAQELRSRNEKLSSEAGALRAKVDEYSEQKAHWSSARESYREFLNNVSHEVANPLQSIQTNLDNMTSCSPDDTGRWRQFYQIIADEVQRLVRLMERLRLLSRLESPDAPTVRQPVNMRAVVEDVIMTLYEDAEASGMQLVYVGPQRPARVMGDRDSLRQVLINLVDNGIKYSRDKGNKVVISVQEEQDRLCVRVADQGIGIAEEDLAHVFDGFYRPPHIVGGPIKGTGLGLMLVKRIVEQHGGTIRVQSELGKSTSFSFDLPLYLPSERTRA